MKINEETRCRICRGELKEVLDLGVIYPSNFLGNVDVSEDMKAPLVLAECEDCKLVQLKHTVDLDSMYRQYWYTSSLNMSMVSSLADVVRDVEGKIDLSENDLVIDIGANDCTLLSMYSNKKLLTVGFEPALNLKPKLGSVTTWIPDYFSKESFDSYVGNAAKQAKVITAIAMFYDLPDPHKFVEDAASLLDDEGIFVIQFTDLLSMIKALAFDNVCHEHLEYYKLADIKYLLETHGLEIIDVSYNDVNGGSLRVTAAHEGKYPVQSRVVKFLVDEFNFLQGNSIQDFAKRIETTRLKVKSFLDWSKFHGHVVYLMGASTKGNTLLQVCNITNEDIPYAAEVNKDKFGLRTVGSNIEIISETDALIKHPKCFFVPIWHFKNSLLRNPRIIDYLKSGGSLVFPLPYFHVVYADQYTGIKEVNI